MLRRPLRRAAFAVRALVAVLALVPVVRADDVGARLDALEAGGAHERRAAEAALADVLEPRHVSELSAWIDGAAAEGRARLASALARRDASLAIVLELARTSDGTGAVAQVVRGALDGLVARFEPGFFAEPLTGFELDALLDRLAEQGAPAIGRLDVGRPPLEVVRDLARWDGMPVRLVIDPALAGAPAPEPSLFREPTAPDGTIVEGTWRELIGVLATFDLSVEAHLFEPESELDEPQVAFLRVTRRGLDGRVTARTWFGRLLERLDDASQPREAREAARALASSGWPAAQALLLQRFRATRDLDALAGLLWGAELGLAPPSFPTREDVRVALDAAWRDIDGELLAGTASAGKPPGAFARDVLEGLVQLPRLTPTGEPLFDAELLASPALSGAPFDGALVPAVKPGLSSPARAAFALELTARARVSTPGLRERLAAWLVDERVPPHLRRWALSAWTRVFSDPAPTPARALELIAAAEDRSAADSWVWLFAASGAPVPPAWSASSDGAVFDGASPRALSIVAAWALAREDVEAAAACVRAAIDGRSAPDPFAAPSFAGRRELARAFDLVRRRGGADLARRVFERVLAGAPSADAALSVLELRAAAGFVAADDADTHALLYETAVARRAAAPPGDPELLAALVAGPAGARARSLLLGDFVAACESAPGARAHRARVSAALSRAMAELLAAGEDQLARRLASDLRRLARERSGHGLGGEELVLAARSGDWPRPAGWDAVDLSRPGAIH